MTIQLEVSKNDIAILDAISRLVENNRDKSVKTTLEPWTYINRLKNKLIQSIQISTKEKSIVQP